MKIKNLVTIATLALTAAVAPFAAWAEGMGNIYEIRPVNEHGEVCDAPTEPVGVGSTVRFVVRLAAPTLAGGVAGNPFRLVHKPSLNTEATDWALMNRPAIGVFINGKLTPMYLESLPTQPAENFTDLIFAYTVKPGDLALPVCLATSDMKMVSDLTTDPTYFVSYGLKTPAWQIDDSTAEGGAATQEAVFQYGSVGMGGSIGYPVTPPSGDRWGANFDLSQCKFMIRTVEFDTPQDPDPYTAGYWRTVPQGEAGYKDMTSPRLVLNGGVAPTNNATKIYLWSEDERAVYLAAGKPRQVNVTAGETEERHVLEIDTVADYNAEIGGYEFQLAGAAAGKGKSANIVMSAFPNFNYQKSGEAEPSRLPDYIFVPVMCGEPSSAKVTVRPGKTPVTARHDYTVYVTTLDVSFNRPFAEDVWVEIVPSFTDEAWAVETQTNWWDYVRFSASGDDPDPAANVPTGNPKVLIPANGRLPVRFEDGTAIDGGKIYVYALRTDAHVTGAANKMTFAVRTDNENALKPSVDGGIDGWNAVQGTLNINGEAPAVTSMFDGVWETSAVADSPRSLKIVVSDVYADTVSTNGYEVWLLQNNDAAVPTFEKVEGLFVPDSDGLLHLTNTTDVLPSVKYKDVGLLTSSLYVKSPVSRKQSSAVNFQVNVSIPAGYTVETVDGVTDFKEGDTTQLKIVLDERNTYGTMYAFLKPENTAASNAVSCSWLAAAVEGNSGIRLEQFDQELSAGCTLAIVDGDASKLGSTFNYTVVFCSQQTWDPDKVVTAYRAKNVLRLTTHNVTPSIGFSEKQAYVQMNGNSKLRAYQNGDVISQTFPMNVEQTFTAKVYEPGTADLEATGKNAFQMRWFFEDEDGAVYGPKEADMESAEPGVIKGNPNASPAPDCHFSFPSPGKWTVTVELKDKDMSDFGNAEIGEFFTFYVNVVDQPKLSIKAEPYYSEYESSDMGVTTEIDLELEINPCNFELEVEVEVKPVAEGSVAPGVFVLETNDGCKKKAGTDNVYVVTVPKKATSVPLYVKSLDGTRDSYNSGFWITPTMISTETVPNSGNKAANAYYQSAPLKVKVENEDPLLDLERDVRPKPTSTNAIQTAIGKSTTVITWSFNDVESEFLRKKEGSKNGGAGIKVAFRGCTGWEPKWYTSLDEALQDGEKGFSPEFTESGVYVVDLVITDPDGGEATASWTFEVRSSKTISMVAHGPSSGNGGPNGKRYSTAAGLGEGRVWSESQSAIVVENWESLVNCGVAKDWKIYGFGYKVGDVDGGAAPVLHYPDGRTGYFADRDTPITDKGATWAAGSPGYAYQAPKDENGNPCDSFLYTWLLIKAGEDGGDVTDSILGSASKPEYSEVKDAYKKIKLEAEPGEDGGYEKTVLEAIFSVEYLASDNMGDINQDGIPDVYIDKFGLGVADPGAGTISGNDLAKVHDFNDDDDYLPTTGVSLYGSLIPGLAESWATVGRPFTARLEIRGYGEALNDAPDNNKFTRIKDLKPDRVYTNPATDKKSTLTEVEWLAWSEFKAAYEAEHGDGTASPELWSPERPTDPTVEDTNDDGFPDGYQYHFWYLAHVGYIDPFGQHRRLTGRVYDPQNPGTGKVLPPEEIEKLMDPARSAADSTGAETRDSDNDGLPDLIEFEIGTNPFDFDSDNDGLPDGWEIVVSGTDPLRMYTSDDTIADTVRNYDGDAMAFASVEREAEVLPRPLFVQRYNTFATVRPGGDTDGVQWYAETPLDEGKTAMTYELVVSNATEALKGTHFKVDGVDYVTTGAVARTAEKVLAATLSADCTFVVTNIADGVKALGDLEAPESCQWLRLMPTRVPAGTIVEEDPEPDAEYACAVVKAVGKDAVCNAAWPYGRSVFGGNAETGYATFVEGKDHLRWGMLAMARYEKPAVGAPLAALPTLKRDVAFLHYLVYQQFGFDPRTAWNPNTPLAARWGKTASGQAYADQNGEDKGYAGQSTRTREFSAYDEFLLLTFWLNNNAISLADVTAEPQTYPWSTIWRKFTTCPRGPSEPAWVSEVDLQGASAATDGNGADTDGDGVPDGWELYVMAGPKMDKEDPFAGTSTKVFVFAPPYASFLSGGKEVEPFVESSFSPFVKASSDSVTDNEKKIGKGENDGLTELEEFAGTDSCAYYSEVQNGNAVAYSTTIVRPESQAKWLNKFFPTDPWAKDTDNDGITDGDEGAAFVYAETVPEDDKTSVSFAGCGLNPCSVDTDQDGLPDGWEKQFTLEPGEAVVSTNVVEGLLNCMDGTVSDALTKPDGPNRDYDRDGLENWQEYMTGIMRCWRYDDPYTQWKSIPYEMYFNAKGQFEPNFAALGVKGKTLREIYDDFWYQTLVDKKSPIYNPHLLFEQSPSAQFLSRVDKGWDPNYIDSVLDTKESRDGRYYWFAHRIGAQPYKKAWPENGYGDANVPVLYASCSPISPDTDKDGMDDYYELFHGMNPLLGSEGVGPKAPPPCDIVGFLASEQKSSVVWSGYNWWTLNPIGVARGNSPTMDFTVYQWRNGLQEADADGDNERNYVESIMARLEKDAWMHTDPTPLWMTDVTYSNSLSRLHYRMPDRSSSYAVPISNENTPEDTWCGKLRDTNGDLVPGFRHAEKDAKGNVVTNSFFFRDFDGIDIKAFYDKTAPCVRFTAFVADRWSVGRNYVNPRSPQRDGESRVIGNWMFSFEENEGFDTDHDGADDAAEIAGQTGTSSDPLDADSPRRRQAMYFPGANSALQTPPALAEEYPISGSDYDQKMTFKRYTVECWVKPDADGETVPDSIIVERAICTDPATAGDQELIRKNFQLAVRNGKWFTKFDSNGTDKFGETGKFSSEMARPGVWTHLAATYDGRELVLYVNGLPTGDTSDATLAKQQPENGSFSYVFSVGAEGAGDLRIVGNYSACAIIVGAGLKTYADIPGVAFADKEVGYALNVYNGMGWENYKGFFKGYVDEVRVWDGARTAKEIAGSMKVRYDAGLAKANRAAFYDEWRSGRNRHEDNATPLMAELRYHFAFDSLFAAENEKALRVAPAGFAAGDRAPLIRPEGYVVPWWKAVLEGYGSAYAGAANYVTWIPNTVARLPRFDGTTVDSFYYSEDFAGAESGKFDFANTADPYVMWTQCSFGREPGEYNSTSTRHHLLGEAAYASTDFMALYDFTGRLRMTEGSDLLPLGGAYARYVTDMWDGQGPGSMNELSGGDADADGLPDWWEKYADENYRGDLDPAVKIDWNTKIFYNGRMMTAGEAYLRDLARGAYADSALEYAIDAKYEQVADVNGSGMPDWWTSLYGIAGESGLDDHDRDGLPNEVEYLLSECFDFKVLFNPSKACSVDEYTPDYFYRVGDLYVGEIFTDHDLVDDDWEDLYDDKYASRLLWDAYEDFDQDGWSNRSEYRYARMSMPIQADKQSHYASTDVTDSSDGRVVDYPIPTIALTVKYGGARIEAVAQAPIIVKMTTDEDLTGDFDATFNVVGETGGDGQTGKSSGKDDTTGDAGKLKRYLGKWSNRHVIGTLTPGYIKKDSVLFQFAYDPSAEMYSWSYETSESIGSNKVVRSRRGTMAELQSDLRKYPNVTIIGRTSEFHVFDKVELRTTGDSTEALWFLPESGKSFGTLDLQSGAFDIDLGVFAGMTVYNVTNAADVVSLEDQTFRIAYTSNMPKDLPRKLYLGEATSGHVREGKNKIVAWADLDGDGAYTPGEPFGCAVGVDVSWKGTSAEIELTETSVVSPRMNIATGASDREVVWGSESGYWTNLVVGALNGGTKTRVRVIRTIYNSDLVTGLKALGIADSVSQRVVLDKYVDLNSWPVITEADFLSESIHDIDWLTLSSDILSPLGGKLKDLGRMYYRVVLGEGTIDLAVENNLFNVLFSRAFDSADARVKPTDLRPGPQGGQEVLAATPTFKWSMGEANTYTAFRVQVKSAAGTVVYDSGYQRAPQNADGNYEWTPSLLRAGDKTTSGQVFADQAQYTWQVSMYNSKFTSDLWATEGKFFLNANGAGTRGTAQVAVRYFGPKLSYAGKTIRVKAFASPDFTGSPVASGYVAAPDDAETGVGVTGKVVKANCQVIGIPKGTYYLQAFIDSNGNGVCDKWESMGYLCDRIGKDVDNFDPVAMTFADARGEGDLATIYIEDADTDGDSLPDAWEYAKKGNLTALGVGDAELTALGGRLVAKDLEAAVLKAAGDNPVAAGLAGRILTTMNSSRMFMALASGVAPEALDPDAEITITGLQFNAAENAVEIAFSGVVTSPGDGISNALYAYRPGDSLKFQVYHTETLAAEWQPVGEVKTVPVSAGNVGDKLKVDMTGLNVKGGFFKVVVLP